jgi:hypothetical protein
VTTVLRRAATVAATFAASAAVLIAPASAAQAAPAGVLVDFDHDVVPWKAADVLQYPYIGATKKSYVIKNAKYRADCWGYGDTITDGGITNDVWVKLKLNSGGHGWVSAVYLKGNERGDVPWWDVC